MFLSLASHQLLLILKAGFSRDRQQWKCDETTTAVLCFQAQDLDRLGTTLKYSEGVSPGHLLLSEQKCVHRPILCITSGRPQAPWALQVPQVKSSWPGSERKQRRLFHRPHSDLRSHHIPTPGPVRGTVAARRALPAARPPEINLQVLGGQLEMNYSTQISCRTPRGVIFQKIEHPSFKEIWMERPRN